MSAPSRPEPNYFGAGPALLPTNVLEEAAADLLNYQSLGVGVGEMSHRSSQATDIINETKENFNKILNIPDTHEVFFAQGGGTGGFAAVVYNMLASFAQKTGKKGKVDYFITGAWSQKASEEAERLGADVNIVADARKFNNGKYGVIPAKSEWKFSDPSETAYVYYCDNETVAGVEFAEVPEVPEGVELVADMSSNILSKELDVSKFGLIFGGAQKNIGIAGVSFYVIKKSLLDRLPQKEANALGIQVCPIFLDFPSIVKNNSAYNTVSILCIHIINLVLKNLLAKGGLSAQESLSKRKAQKVYSILDQNPALFNLPVDKSARSNMNIVFTINGEGNEEKFLKGSSARGLSGLKGHRSVGGIRVSNYNAVTEESIDKLIEFVKDFIKEASV
ncbi:phosphoserine aminotransferase [Nadsonia fulvescens var. elongata DSM 6958]|uniref:phosphoserine transaminase n=1 Tax=Nadsonia fulvescens var. elongata DSM 6958 TaxID=857566 RepID=A0A1E3PIL6_9ASCO|nr:phosphoserine aminotransferase [Nadsonia fulvescens var. elongata DSM 6958]